MGMWSNHGRPIQIYMRRLNSIFNHLYTRLKEEAQPANFQGQPLLSSQPQKGSIRG